MTRHYTVNDLDVTCDGDVWTIPALRDVGAGLLERCTLVFCVHDGVACDPHCVGEPPADCIYKIETSSELLGWGDHDCEQSYVINSCRVSGPVLDKIAEWTGLQLPAHA